MKAAIICSTLTCCDCHVAPRRNYSNLNTNMFLSTWPSGCHVCVISDPTHLIASYCRSITQRTMHKCCLSVHPFHPTEELREMIYTPVLTPSFSPKFSPLTVSSHNRAYVLQVIFKYRLWKRLGLGCGNRVAPPKIKTEAKQGDYIQYI